MDSTQLGEVLKLGWLCQEEAPRLIPSCHSGGYRCVGECSDGPSRAVVFKHHGSQPVQILLPKGGTKPAER